MIERIFNRLKQRESANSAHPLDGRGDGSESGFSYIDVLIATAILMTGVLALMSAMTTALVTTSQGQQQAQAKQIATSTMESIFSARDVGTAAFNQVANTTNNGLPGGNLPGGIFLTGSQNVYGFAPTSSSGSYTLTAGPDGIYGTADDSQPVNGQTPVAIPGVQRTITINDISNPSTALNLRQIVVTVTYQFRGFQFSQSITSYMANYTVLNPGTSGN